MSSMSRFQTSGLLALLSKICVLIFSHVDVCKKLLPFWRPWQFRAFASNFSVEL